MQPLNGFFRLNLQDKSIGALGIDKWNSSSDWEKTQHCVDAI